MPLVYDTRGEKGRYLLARRGQNIAEGENLLRVELERKNDD